MRQVPKASGGDHGNQYTGGKINTDDKFATSKTKVISDMGFTPMQVSRFETLAAHPEIVAQAKAEGQLQRRCKEKTKARTPQEKRIRANAPLQWNNATTNS